MDRKVTIHIERKTQSMNMNDVKTFVKEHKKEIAIAAVATVAAAGGVAVFARRNGGIKFVDINAESWNENVGEAIKLATGSRKNVTDKMAGLVDHVPVSTLGKFGEEIMYAFDVSNDAEVRVAFLDQALCLK